MTDIVILSWVDFEPGDRALYLEHSTALMVGSNDEPGCIRHVVAADPLSETAVIAHAHYRDQAAFEEHLESEPFARFLQATKELRVRERRTDRFEANRVS